MYVSAIIMYIYIYMCIYIYNYNVFTTHITEGTYTLMAIHRSFVCKIVEID